MAKREPITVNGHSFKTKKALRKHIRKIRDSYLDGQRINEVDFEFMLDLLNHHEEPEIKIGCGVAYMYVKTNEVFKRNREFWLVRIDGSETDFSFEICLKHETKLKKFKNACRTSIADVVMDFKKDFFDRVGEPSICPITGEPMTLRRNSHVDHAHPDTFDKIVQDFISLNDLDVNEIELLTAEDGRVRNEMADKTLERQFVEFHNQKAKLRVISKLANLSLAKYRTNHYSEEQTMNTYPPNWHEIAQQIKDLANWHCEHCQHPHDPSTGYCLTVHHLDGDKANCDYTNLVALCQRCHLHIQARYHPLQLVIPFTRPGWMVRRGLGA